MNVNQYFISRGFGGETLGECERAPLQQALFAERKHAVVAEMNAAQALHKYNVSRKALAAAMVKPLSIDFALLGSPPCLKGLSRDVTDTDIPLCLFFTAIPYTTIPISPFLSNLRKV